MYCDDISIEKEIDYQLMIVTQRDSPTLHVKTFGLQSIYIYIYICIYI